MLTEHQIVYIESVKKHNKRVDSIREKRLPKSCIEAIDQTLNKGDALFENMMETLYWGATPSFTTDEIAEFRDALIKLRKQFTRQEMPFYAKDLEDESDSEESTDD